MSIPKDKILKKKNEHKDLKKTNVLLDFSPNTKSLLVIKANN